MMRKLLLATALLASFPVQAAYTPDAIKSTGGTVSRTVADHFSDVYNAADYGVVCDGTQLADINIANGTNVITSASVNFDSRWNGAHAVVTDTNETAILNTTVSGISGGSLLLAANWPNAALTNNTGRITLYFHDNTANINGAIYNIISPTIDKNANNTKGFKLNFPDGVCATRLINAPRLSKYSCTGGAQACTIFLISGANSPLLKSENFDVLTGTGLNYGPTGTYNGRASDMRVPTHVGLEDIHLDCNKLGQTTGSGDCVELYGAALILTGTVLVDEGYRNCIYTEMSDASAWSLTDWKSYEEGDFSGTIKTRNCGQYGMLHRGNKDAKFGVFIDAESASTGFRNEISAGYYAGTIDDADLIHGYAEADHTSVYFGAPANVNNVYLDYANGEIAANSVSINHVNTTACGFGGVTCLKVDSGTTDVTIGSAEIEFYPGISNVIGLDIEGQQGTYSNIIMSAIAPGTGVTGIKLGNSFNTLTGLQLHNMAGSNDTCLYLGGGQSPISGTMFSCYNFIDPTGDAGQNIIDLSMYKGSGTNYKTAYGFQASDYIRISHDDGTYVTQGH